MSMKSKIVFVLLLSLLNSAKSDKKTTKITKNVKTTKGTTNLTIVSGHCGVVNGPASFIAGNPWKKSELRWKLLNQYMPNLGIGRFRSMIHQSFDDWARHSSLRFYEVNENDKADIELSFLPQHLDDLRRFDGAAGTLAYAYFPPTGIIRFEAEEKWTDAYDDQTSFNFRLVATHEIGHALGLSHSDVRESIMYAEYQRVQPNDVIKYDDIRGIQFLYGAGTNRVTQPYYTIRSTRPTTTTRIYPPYNRPYDDGRNRWPWEVTREPLPPLPPTRTTTRKTTKKTTRKLITTTKKRIVTTTRKRIITTKKRTIPATRARITTKTTKAYNFATTRPTRLSPNTVFIIVRDSHRRGTFTTRNPYWPFTAPTPPRWQRVDMRFPQPRSLNRPTTLRTTSTWHRKTSSMETKPPEETTNSPLWNWIINKVLD